MPHLSASRRRFLAAAVGSIAPAIIEGSAKAAQFDLKAASSLPPDHPLGVRAMQMFAAIEQESGGRIHVQFFPNSILGGDSSMFSQVRTGAIAFFFNNPGNLASVVPAADIGNIGFVYRNEDEACRVMDGPLGAYLRSEVAAKDMFMLPAMWDSGMYQIASNARPIKSPDDLHGFRIRVSESRIAVDLYKDLGANPVALSGGEMYSALQTKVVDGVGAPATTMETLKLYEVNKYLTMVNWAWSGLWLMVSADIWKSFPPDLQAIVTRNNARSAIAERKDAIALNASLAARLGQQGLAVNSVDPGPFRARLSSYYQYWSNAFGQRAWDLLESSLGRKLS